MTLIELPERVGGRPLPEVEVVDMRREFERGNRSIFSARLSEELRDCLGRGRQAMLLINRRGHSSFVSCRKCGYVVKCASCDVSMTYHQAENVLRCHYCGAERAVPQKCPECGSPYIKFFGVGTEQVVEEVQRQFPEATVLRMDYDTTRKKDAHAKILEAFRQGEADILVGTQMIAKGLDFPNVTLSGVVAADMTAQPARLPQRGAHLPAHHTDGGARRPRETIPARSFCRPMSRITTASAWPPARIIAPFTCARAPFAGARSIRPSR